MKVKQGCILRRAVMVAMGAVLTVGALGVQGSSHREAPFITEVPKLDGTDFYLFNSYETGRKGFVTAIANYVPLQDPVGGPNYFTMDPQAVYAIHVDHDGDSRADLSFEFRFQVERKDIALDIGGVSVPVPLINVGAIGPGLGDTSALNVVETFTATAVRHTDNGRVGARITNSASGDAVFTKPVDNIGQKSLPEYQAYANQHIYDVDIPSCGPGRLFVGQRQEPFVVNLGEVFDLVNTNPLGPVDGETNSLAGKNITSIALEAPASCWRTRKDHVIGAWTTASVPRYRELLRDDQMTPGGSQENTAGEFVQVSRLGSPLVNEVIIGLKDKDRFNASMPSDDGQFLHYVTNPTLPALLEVLFGVRAPNLFPRDDLIQAFLTGVPDLNQPLSVTPAEMLRLNTATTPVAAADQNPLGVIGGDVAGFPNGRRPGDDVVDIALRVVMGVLLDGKVAPDGQLPYTDGAYVDASMFDQVFPYIRTPLPGALN